MHTEKPVSEEGGHSGDRVTVEVTRWQVLWHCQALLPEFLGSEPNWCAGVLVLHRHPDHFWFPAQKCVKTTGAQLYLWNGKNRQTEELQKHFVFSSSRNIQKKEVKHCEKVVFWQTEPLATWKKPSCVNTNLEEQQIGFRCTSSSFCGCMSIWSWG